MEAQCCSSLNQSQRFLCDLLKLLKPIPRLTLSQWAAAYRYTSREASAEVGKWVTRPYQREPLDEFTNPRVRSVVIMSAVQMLKTEFILNAIGYVIHVDPGPTLVVQFRDTDCDIFSKRRLAPMLRDTPILRDLVADSKSRSSGNTITDKTFPGGHIRIGASASPGNLAALPIRYLFCDEIDKYPPSSGPEGDPITLAEGRTAEFPISSKEILTCSPTIKGSSRIDKAFEESDKREYFVPCPHCGEFQVLKWSQVVWDSKQLTRKKQAESAVYVCEFCKEHWDDAARWKAVYLGEYHATASFNGIAGFRISSLCSLKKRLSQLVAKFLNAQGDQERLKAFINTELAECWEEKGEAPEWEILLSRREEYPTSSVPKGGVFLTAGADVHPDRIECEIVAWGRGKESWSVEYRILEGKVSEPEVWKKLEALRSQVYTTETGAELPISMLCVDSGDHTQEVYNWVRTQPSSQVQAIKGWEKGILPVGQPVPVEITVGGHKIKAGIKLRMVNVSFFKSEIYSNLKARRPTDEEIAAGLTYPPGYCHFPGGENYGDEHFKQLCAETLIPRPNKRTGRTKKEWVQNRPRNEALDCRVYARAAAWIKGLDRMQDKHWQQLEGQLIVAAKPNRTPVKENPEIQQNRSGGRNESWLRGRGKNWLRR